MNKDENGLTPMPEFTDRNLNSDLYRRTDPRKVGPALEALKTHVSETFRGFYERFQGPFYSKALGYELADLCELSPTVQSLTNQCREAHGWPNHFVVLTDLFGDAVLVLEGPTDRVYEVDFEGSDEELLAGKLAPTWESFASFLSDFLSSSSPE